MIEGTLSCHRVCQDVCGVLKKKKKHSTKSETIFLCTDPDGGKGLMSCHITPDQYFQIYNRALCHKILRNWKKSLFTSLKSSLLLFLALLLRKCLLKCSLGNFVMSQRELTPHHFLFLRSTGRNPLPGVHMRELLAQKGW